MAGKSRMIGKASACLTWKGGCSIAMSVDQRVVCLTIFHGLEQSQNSWFINTDCDLRSKFLTLSPNTRDCILSLPLFIIFSCPAALNSQMVWSFALGRLPHRPTRRRLRQSCNWDFCQLPTGMMGYVSSVPAIFWSMVFFDERCWVISWGTSWYSLDSSTKKTKRSWIRAWKHGLTWGKKKPIHTTAGLKTDIFSHWCCRLAGRFAEDHGDTFASGNLETSPSIAALWAAQEAELAKEASTLVGKCDKHGERWMACLKGTKSPTKRQSKIASNASPNSGRSYGFGAVNASLPHQAKWIIRQFLRKTSAQLF